MAEVGKLSIRLVADGSELGKGIADEVEKAGGNNAALGAAKKWGGRLGKAIVAGGVAAGIKGVMDFTSFEKGMAEVFTLLPDASAETMGALSDDVKNFSKEFGVLPNATIPALYQALSAGVPPNNVFDFLATAQQAAKGGVTELETAVDGISSVVNAYGGEIMDATTASDLMFTAVRLGKTTFDELASSLFQVTPTAAALGVPFEDVTGALAALTAQGVPTSVATTQLRQMFVELSKDGTETSKIFEQIAGKTFKDFIAEGGNTADALGLLTEYAEDAGLGVNDLFGSVEAGSAALALGKDDAKSFRGALDEMGKSTGATQKAFTTMESTMGSDMEKLKANLSVLSIALGENLAPAFSKVIEFGIKLAEWFGGLDPTVQGFIVAIGLIGGAILAFAGPIMKVIELMKILKVAFMANPWMLLIAGIIIVVTLIIVYWDEIMAAVKAALEWIGDAISTAWNFIKDVTSKVWNGIKDFIKKFWPVLLTIIAGPIGLIVALIIKNWDTIKEVIGKAIDFVTDIITTGFDLIKGIFETVWNGIKDTISTVIDGIKGFFQGLIDKGQDIVNWFTELPGKIGGFFMDIKDRIMNRINDVKGFFQGLIDKGQDILNFFRNMPGEVGGFFVDLFNRVKEQIEKLITWFGTLKDRALDALGPVGKVIDFGGRVIGGAARAIGGIFRAEGGPAMMGRPYIVGEEGPELIVPSRSGTVIPAEATAGLMSGGAGVMIQGPLIANANITSPEDITRLSRELARDIDRRQRATGNRLGATV